jgi:hypothetical protein
MGIVTAPSGLITPAGNENGSPRSALAPASPSALTNEARSIGS